MLTPSQISKYLFRCFWLLVAIIVLFCSGRLYYFLTDGFLVSNITYNHPYDERWDVHPLSPEENRLVDSILNQKFFYLGKGCQSYVFVSEDNRYVIKFLKYQRIKPQVWLDHLAFIPVIDRYRQKKKQYKQYKLEKVFTGWKIAYEDLPKETGVVFVHLNKSNHLNKTVLVYDKIGLQHTLNLDEIEFMIQKKADMLCPTLDQLMINGRKEEAEVILNRLLDTLVNEYKRGLADNDHALMQNTGVYEGHPIHIDSGLFVKNPTVKEPDVFHQELINKTWKFRQWLQSHHPELDHYLVERLKAIIGPVSFSQLRPRLRQGNVGMIPHTSPVNIQN